MECRRCKKETTVWIMSMFNTDNICMKCKELEKQLPEYDEAVKTELNEVKKGNYNFKGIGLKENNDEETE